MTTELFVACPLPPDLIDRLNKNFLLHFNQGSGWNVESKLSQSVRGIVTNGIKGADQPLIELFPKAEIIASLGVGVDTIDLESARQRGLVVTNTPDIVTNDVADLAIAMVIDVLRRISVGQGFVRTGKWTERPFPLARSVTGKTLGIVGLGAIGKAIAQRAEAFGMRVKWYGPRAKPDVSYTYVPDLKLLALESDVLVVACSGGQSTHKLIDAPVLAALGQKGSLVNISRGSVVDTAALIAALKANQLAGAALDVIDSQPHVPQELLNMDNVVLTPHIGTATQETRSIMAGMVVESLLDHFSGKTPKHRVI